MPDPIEEDAVKTVLVVDGDASSAALGEILRRRGFLGVAARTARDALNIIRNDLPIIDLVVTEMQVPDMDGLQFLCRLRALAPSLPIIVVTSSGSIENYLHAVNIGVYEYLNKPVLPKELLRIANIAMNGQAPAASPREAS